MVIQSIKPSKSCYTRSVNMYTPLDNLSDAQPKGKQRIGILTHLQCCVRREASCSLVLPLSIIITDVPQDK